MNDLPPIPRVPFLYLRHGETDWNAESRAQGSSDIPLNERGREQARDAARILAAYPCAGIIASPLSRARETAEIVAAARGMDVAIETGLHEVSFGAGEGEVMGRWYEEWLVGHATPEGGESFDALVDRARQVLIRRLAQHDPAGPPLLFVAHGALFRAIRRALGQSIHVRLANGAPLLCKPAAEGWTIDLLP
jgi:probable phosphoglycerate mutase